MYNNDNESVGDINGRVQQQGILESTRQSQGIYEEGQSKQTKEFTRAEYEQWEKSVQPIDDGQLNSEQKSIKDNIKQEYNKDIVFFDGENNIKMCLFRTYIFFLLKSFLIFLQSC